MSKPPKVRQSDTLRLTFGPQKVALLTLRNSETASFLTPHCVCVASETVLREPIPLGLMGDLEVGFKMAHTAIARGAWESHPRRACTGSSTKPSSGVAQLGGGGGIFRKCIINFALSALWPQKMCPISHKTRFRFYRKQLSRRVIFAEKKGKHFLKVSYNGFRTFCFLRKHVF